MVEIPAECIAKDDDLITEVFGERLISANYADYANKAILAPKNVDTFKLNRKVLELLDTEKCTYYSADSIINDDAGKFAQIPTEYLNKLIPSGLPEHELQLKVGAIILYSLNSLLNSAL